jgi:hypothetical protein
MTGVSDSQLRARARVTGWGVYAALFLLISTLVHAGTYVGRSLSPNTPFFIGLNVGIIPVFIALVLRSRSWQPEIRGPFGKYYRQLDWRAWRPFLPAWAYRVVDVLGAYAIGNFLFAVAHLPPRGTTAVLTDAQAMYMARMFSGHWLVFYALPLLFFTYEPEDGAPSTASPHAAA